MQLNRCLFANKPYAFTVSLLNCIISINIIIIIIITSLINNIDSTCTQTYCNLTNCPDTTTNTKCLYGITLDECQCCHRCLKTIGETCGPNDRCADGLQCLSDRYLDALHTNLVTNDQRLTTSTTGVCGVIDCSGGASSCKDVGAITDGMACHNDSYKLVTTNIRNCCQTTCVCLPGVCNESQIVCPNNTVTRVVKQATGRPGSCCNQIECIAVPKNCIHNSLQYINGDKWLADKCTTCECRDGLAFCYKKSCNHIDPKNCHSMTQQSYDECCPSCQGCISSNGKFYNNTHQWYENDCSYCQCNMGRISCQVQMCSPVHCDKPVRIDGQCCPVCATPLVVSSTFSCDLYCPQGYKRNALGHQLCECDNCPNKTFNCHIFCPFGFKRRPDGCPICQCITYFNTNYDIKLARDGCTLNNGSLIVNGYQWDDGCRQCLCNYGKIMCTKPNCPSVQCSANLLKSIDGICCPVCDNSISSDLNENREPLTTGSAANPHLLTVAILLTLFISIVLLGIFTLLAVYLIRRYSNVRYTTNRVPIPSDNTLIHLLSNNINDNCDNSSSSSTKFDHQRDNAIAID
ncbi:cysteine-rich motor neuron 1 protein-like [Oppia nitens]|uniref:cysteine-rich motor neuron 1 protein-like n=1 Tax=Oppia nitens TaxID=1686743 RepID=UPI0023DB680E|nr:cysteine-rich motor neuron 1 protein-like [Oppia nitens]